MGRLGTYKVELKEMQESQASYDWTVDNEFFSLVGGEDVQKGKVHVSLAVTNVKGVYLLEFSLDGHVMVICDRCLDEMPLPIETTGSFQVRLGADFADDGDTVIVPEKDGTINVAFYIYEFITLAIPLKHVHAPGKCNKDMMDKLNAHSKSGNFDNDSEEGGFMDEPQETDPRWDGLKGLMDSENFD